MPQDLIASSRLRVGINPRNFPALPPSPQVLIAHDDATNPENLVLVQFTTDINGPTTQHIKGRGSMLAPADVVSADRVFDHQAYAYSGGTVFNGANIRAYIDGAFVSGQAPPMRLVLETGLANAAAAENLAVFSNGGVTIGAAKIARGVGGVLGLLNIGGDGTVEAYAERASADAVPARLAFRKTRGTLAAPAHAAALDYLLYIAAETRSTTIFETSSIRVLIDNAIVAGQRPPTGIVFYTNALNTVPAPNMGLFSNGFLTLGPDQVAIGPTGAAGYLHIGGNSTTQQIVERNSADITSSKILFRKARGTLAAPADVVDGDQLGRIEFDGRATSRFIPVQLTGDVDGAVTAGQMPPGAFRILTAPQNGSLTNRLRVYSGGLVHIGDSGSPSLTRKLYVTHSSSGTPPVELQNSANSSTAHVVLLRGGSDTTAGSDFLQFFRPDGTKIGDVDQNSAITVIYNVTSDARLKENIVDSEKGLDALMQMKARRFNYRADPQKQSMIGFIAQEVHAVFPEAVSVGSGDACDCNALGVKDEADKWDGKHVFGCEHVSPWGVDYGRITPLLVKAIQELAGRVKTLEG